ncbi:MAG: DUF1015 domain-containing protein [Pirellulaceae bacterium]
MPKIKAFRALRPRPELASTVASVPYDVVDREEAVELAKDNPHSFLHVVRPDIDLPADTNPYDDAIYAKASENLNRFLREEVLRQDAEESIFLYRQVMNGVGQVGVVCCCHIDDYENNRILKHEKTRKAKEDDRTRHVLELGAHAGPVFLTYRDDQPTNERVSEAIKEQPLYDFTAVDGVRHTVWRISDPAPYVASLSAIDKFYVADGHHRAASAWRAGVQRRSENPSHHGNEEYNWFLTVLFPASELNILAYNRIIKDLNGQSPQEVLERLKPLGQLQSNADPTPNSAGSFCFYLDGAWHRLTAEPDSIERNDPIRSLDVAILEDRVLKPIFAIEDVRTDSRIDFVGGIRGTKELEKRVNSGNWACAVSMYPTSIEQLMNVSDADEIMPPKEHLV